MEPRIEISSTGLKCDNPECDWRDPSIDYTSYATWVNTPCPKCGQNVLTEEDYRNVEKLLAAAHTFNSMTSEEINNITADADMEQLKKHPLLKDIEGIEEANNLKSKISISYDTHKEIKVTKIEIV